jgi:tRNA/tmRNA/rRNA uracil-C5-methylase (TrmA/RlmC/RlmD family)
MFRNIFEKHLSGTGPAGAAVPEGACITSSSRICRLCHASSVDYPAEADARDRALRDFWKPLFPGTPIAPLVRSPLGRGYRTVSKRKAFPVKGETRLGLIDAGGEEGHRPLDVAACRVEPPSHAAVYTRMRNSILSSPVRPLLPVLRYVIVKGNYSELVVILSVTRIDTGVVSAANSVSRSLTKSCPDVRGVMLYEDRSDGRYYMGTRSPGGRGNVRKIYGDTSVYQKFAGKGFLFPPLAFSQVNASLVDGLIAEAGRMLGLSRESDLYDLYCGYGLFTLTIGAPARRAAGFERTPEAIEAAEANARRLGSPNARFIRSDITGETLLRLLSRMRPTDALLLDPPRGGTAQGVIEIAAARRPGRVVHMFCNIDVVEGEIFRWRKAGYVPVRAVPFDMFPGTDETEIMVLFTPADARREEGIVQRTSLKGTSSTR